MLYFTYVRQMCCVYVTLSCYVAVKVFGQLFRKGSGQESPYTLTESAVVLGGWILHQNPVCFSLFKRLWCGLCYGFDLLCE